MSKIMCKDRAWKWVHTYAAGGALVAAVPIPGSTTIALGVMETTMIYWIAKIYGEELSPKEIVVVAGSLELAGLALKGVALEAANFLPVFGSFIKMGIAASAIEAIGAVIIDHFNDKYPGKLYAPDPSVEISSSDRPR